MPPHLRSKTSTTDPAKPVKDKGIPPGFEQFVVNVDGLPRQGAAQPGEDTQSLADLSNDIIQSTSTLLDSSSLQHLDVQPLTPHAVTMPQTGSPVHDDYSPIATLNLSEAEGSESAAARERRRRKFRQGFAAYTAPPLLERPSAQVRSCFISVI